ncbi:hypothetical protein E2C01_048470 [Portunus trituberculatus]|uniref:Uncharacterized protein n=1 Tax=Portunus trituberculatus TaxID=210409 RepID=A0A5B7GAA8_PORTR|nr:hypothetical protein [Portunus trituberculatus]
MATLTRVHDAVTSAVATFSSRQHLVFGVNTRVAATIVQRVRAAPGRRGVHLPPLTARERNAITTQHPAVTPCPSVAHPHLIQPDAAFPVNNFLYGLMTARRK